MARKMHPDDRHSYNTFELKQLPAIYKLSLFRTDDLGNRYDPLTFFLSPAKALISIEFQVAYLDKVMRYYFEDDNWVAYAWESEAQAMRAPNWKDYPIRLMNREIHDATAGEGLAVAAEVLSRKNAFADIFANLRIAINGGEPAQMALAALEGAVLELAKI